MEPQNQNPIPNTTPLPETEKSIGPAIGIVVIIAVIVIGGLYFWGQRASKQNVEPSTIETDATTTQDQNINDLQKQSSSDDINSIEADLNATDLNQLGNEMNGIEAGAAAVVGAQAQ